MKPVLLAMSMMVFGAAPMTFQGRAYQLGSFSQKTNAMWEFVSAPETVSNWTTLLTVVDRPDAKTPAELDRLAQGILDTYKSRGGKVVMARTMQDASGKPFNYMVVAFDEPGRKRYELNFVKAGLGAKNAYMLIYGARVTDAKDYVGKAKAFLSARSGEIGMELERMAAPAVGALPRREF
jgi:hypothetical protein